MHVIVDAYWQGRNKFKNKIKGQYFDNLKHPKMVCHLGAIYWGTFKKTAEECGNDLAEFYPELRFTVPIPCDDLKDEKEGWISSILVHLNDEHDKRTWPDEKVAEWLEKVLT